MRKRILEIALCAVFFAMLAAPGVQMWKPLIEERPLVGVIEELSVPKLSVSDVLSEKFQRSFGAWFDQHFGFRPTATRLDNSVNYWVFDEMRSDHVDKVGKNGVLYYFQHAWYLNRLDKPRDGFKQMAADTKRLQDLLAARGKYFVYLAMPTKPVVWPKDFPDRWKLKLPDPRPCEVDIYGAWKEEFDRAGVEWVDGRSLVQAELKDDPAAIYSPTGRHENSPATCLILNRGLDLARPHIPSKRIETLDCTYHWVTTQSIDDEALDLYRLLNVWAPQKTFFLPEMSPVDPRPWDGEKADALVVSSSFGWRLLREAERNHVFRFDYFFYYNRTVHDRMGGAEFPVPDAKSREWLDLVLSKDVFLYPLPEEYMLAQRDEFVTALLEALDKLPPSDHQIAK